MLDLPSPILLLRPDLRRQFAPSNKQKRDLFHAWLLQSGIHEYRALFDNGSFAQTLAETGYGPQGSLSALQHMVWQMRPDVRKAFRLPARLAEFQAWFYTHGIEEHPVWHFLQEAERDVVLAQPNPWPSRLKPIIKAQQRPSPGTPTPLTARPFGVNVIGYAFGQLGIGEDARMATQALLAAKVPVTMLNFPPGDDIPQNDRSMARHVKKKGEFAVNVFCMTAEENGRYYAERGITQFTDRYNIGYWPWELGKWPHQWEMMLELVDEVWVSTEHTRAALAPVCTKPLHVMPMAVELGPVKKFASRKQARKHFGLPADATLFCFAFDLKSWIERKNPEACIEAFLEAFPAKAKDNPDVGLVIKTGKPPASHPAWQRLKKLAARDARIHIIEGTLQRPELLALYQACDSFVSLHRAEGFGRGLAEALLLGLHLICTGYSGNVDFCKGGAADLVRYKLVKVRKNEYVHPDGQAWAEPDVHHAAQLMRAFAARGSVGKQGQFPQFAAANVGKLYRKRLQEIAKERGLMKPGKRL
jgi:glycosyltransferase involved in cell wall biosynthesis